MSIQGGVPVCSLGIMSHFIVRAPWDDVVSYKALGLFGAFRSELDIDDSKGGCKLYTKARSLV